MPSMGESKCNNPKTVSTDVQLRIIINLSLNLELGPPWFFQRLNSQENMSREIQKRKNLVTGKAQELINQKTKLQWWEFKFIIIR